MSTTHRPPRRWTRACRPARRPGQRRCCLPACRRAGGITGPPRAGPDTSRSCSKATLTGPVTLHHGRSGPRSPAVRRRCRLPGGMAAGPLAWPHGEVGGTDRAACPGGRVAVAAIPGSALPGGRPATVHAGCRAHHGRGGVPGVRADPLVARCRPGLARAGPPADRRGPAGWLVGRRGRPAASAAGRAAADVAVQRWPGGQCGHRTGAVAIVRLAGHSGRLHGHDRVGDVGDPAESGPPPRGGHRQRHVPGAVSDRPGGRPGHGRAAGVRFVYWVDVASIAAAILATFLISPQPPQAGASHPPGLRSIVTGLRYLRGRPVIQGAYLFDINAMVFGMPRAVFPALAITVFGGGASTLGFLYAAPGAGALLGAVTTGWVHRVRRQGRAVIIAVLVWGAAITCFGLLRWLPAALVLLAVAGWADVISAVFRNTILQLNVPDALRGRLMGVQMAVVTGGPRIGDAESGAVAAAFSPVTSVISGGLACIGGALLLARLLPAFRRQEAAAAPDGAQPAPAAEAA